MSEQTRNDELDAEKKELEIEKLKLEKLKISLETKELKKSSFQKTNWPSILIPLSFTIIPVIYLLFSGIFDSKYQEYKASKASLEYDQRKLNDQKEKLDSLINSRKDSLEYYRDSLQKLKNSLLNSQNELSDDRLALDILKSRTDSLKLAKSNLDSLLRNIKDTVSNKTFSLQLSQLGYEKLLYNYRACMESKRQDLESLTQRYLNKERTLVNMYQKHIAELKVDLAQKDSLINKLTLQNNRKN